MRIKTQYNNNKYSKDQQEFGNLTVAELTQAQKTLERLTQEFFQLSSCLKTGKLLPKSNRLLLLYIFLDEIIKIGRLRNPKIHCEIYFQKRHPIVLPSKHPFTEVIIRNEHIRLDYCGMPTNNDIITRAILAYSLQIFGKENHTKIHKVFQDKATIFRICNKPGSYLQLG